LQFGFPIDLVIQDYYKVLFGEWGFSKLKEFCYLVASFYFLSLLYLKCEVQVEILKSVYL
jgi:hypothetical protein